MKSRASVCSQKSVQPDPSYHLSNFTKDFFQTSRSASIIGSSETSISVRMPNSSAYLRTRFRYVPNDREPRVMLAIRSAQSLKNGKKSGEDIFDSFCTV